MALNPGLMRWGGKWTPTHLPQERQVPGESTFVQRVVLAEQDAWALRRKRTEERKVRLDREPRWVDTDPQDQEPRSPGPALPKAELHPVDPTPCFP